jgi:hypothetical protein
MRVLMETAFPSQNVNGPDQPADLQPGLSCPKLKQEDKDRSLELAGSDFLLGC